MELASRCGRHMAPSLSMMANLYQQLMQPGVGGTQVGPGGKPAGTPAIVEQDVQSVRLGTWLWLWVAQAVGVQYSSWLYCI